MTECHFTGKCDKFEQSPARSKLVGLSNNLLSNLVINTMMLLVNVISVAPQGYLVTCLSDAG